MPIRSAIAALALAAALPVNAAPVNQGPPNAPSQVPAFAGQTRVDEVISGVKFNVEQVASGLQYPWGIDFLPDGRALVTEKPGRLRVITVDRRLVAAPVSGAPTVVYRGQGGLLDVTTAPGKVCLTYSEPRSGGTAGTTARCSNYTTIGDTIALSGHTFIWKQTPSYGGGFGHFGSRIERAPDGNFFITAGERQDVPIRDRAQDITAGMGKVARRTAAGLNPADNPFVSRGGVAAGIWSYGHRNPQGAAVDASGQLWTIEHGPRGGDELNKPQSGKNYGWPIITYGIDYNGSPIGAGITQQAGMEQPIYYWDPVIAPGGMTFYNADLFPRLKGNLLIGSLGRSQLVRLGISGDRVTEEERFDMGARVRDVKVAPDGAIWIITDEANGRVLRLTPRP